MIIAQVWDGTSLSWLTCKKASNGSQAVCCNQKKIGKTTARDFQTPPNQQMYIYYIYIFCRKPIDIKRCRPNCKKRQLFLKRQVLPSEPRIMDDDGRRGGKVATFFPEGNGPEDFFLDPFNGTEIHHHGKAQFLLWNHFFDSDNKYFLDPFWDIFSSDLFWTRFFGSWSIFFDPQPDKEFCTFLLPKPWCKSPAKVET